MNETMTVATKLVELCKQGKNMEAIDALYSPHIVSEEVSGSPAMPARMEGIDAVRAKSTWWEENHEVHSAEVLGPFPHGDRFIVFFNYDVTGKAGPMAGKRFKMEEAGLYTVKDGKVTHEQFFYHMG
jgi:ketosteroid isomerase-like protein